MKKYFLTGATGVVGNAILQKLLPCNDVKIYLLIRAKDNVELEEKIHKLNIPPIYQIFKDKIIIIRGDICKANLGIDEKHLRILCKEIEIIIHAAADIRFVQPLEEARAHALIGTKNIVSFARKCSNLAKINYVSTIGVVGRSGIILPEDEPPKNIYYFNNYEQAKAETEFYIFEEMRKGLPFTIYRPSLIIGDSKTGQIYSKQVFYYICDLIKAGGIYSVLPGLDTFRLDIIPVDYVAEFIVKLADEISDTKGRVFNICCGHINTLQFNDFLKVINDTLSSLNITPTKPHIIPNFLFKVYLYSLRSFADAKSKKKVDLLFVLLDYLENPRLYHNEQYLFYSKEHNLDIQKPLDYLPRVIRAYFTMQNKLAAIR